MTFDLMLNTLCDISIAIDELLKGDCTESERMQYERWKNALEYSIDLHKEGLHQ